MSQSNIAGLQMPTGAPPFRYVAYSKAGEVLWFRKGILPPVSLTIPKEFRKRIARTELIDRRGEVINVWTPPWEVED